MSDSKKWYKSKTVWASILTATVGTLSAVSDVLSAEQAVYIIGLAMPIVNVILRFVTNKPIEV